jgi:hypothetical protein
MHYVNSTESLEDCLVVPAPGLLPCLWFQSSMADGAPSGRPRRSCSGSIVCSPGPPPSCCLPGCFARALGRGPSCRSPLERSPCPVRLRAHRPLKDCVGDRTDDQPSLAAGANRRPSVTAPSALGRRAALRTRVRLRLALVLPRLQTFGVSLSAGIGVCRFWRRQGMELSPPVSRKLMKLAHTEDCLSASRATSAGRLEAST